MTHIKNDYDLQQLALEIAQEAIKEVEQHGGDHYELLDQEQPAANTLYIHIRLVCYALITVQMMARRC